MAITAARSGSGRRGRTCLTCPRAAHTSRHSTRAKAQRPRMRLERTCLAAAATTRSNAIPMPGRGRPAMAETNKELRERPLGEVAKDLTHDVSLLVRQEIELAKAEMAQKGRTAAPGLGMFG